jgi:hypothetical protein
MRIRLEKKPPPAAAPAAAAPGEPAEPATEASPRMLALRATAPANLIWRFYVDPRQRWRWQHLSVQREVIAESPKSYKKYEDCLADATDKGYVFYPSHAKILQGGRR